MANIAFAAKTAAQRAPVRRRQQTEAVAYTLTFSVCFIVFFWAMAIERLVPRAWRQMPSGNGATSLWSTAKNMAHRCTAIAFQG